MTAAILTRPSSKVLTDKQQYLLLFTATFPVFLAAVLLVRLGRKVGLVRRSDGTPKSLFAEARATSSGALLFAFMG